MNSKKLQLLVLLVCSFFTFACVYVVLPEGLEEPVIEAGAELRVWHAIATNVGQSNAGDLHVDITIRNDTGDWATMLALEDQPAVLTTADGKSSNCDTVFIGTGGHRFPPGFQMRGYSVLNDGQQETQLLYVECAGASASAGATLTIKYVSFGGDLDDYEPELNKSEGILEINLDEVSTDLTYPLAAEVEGLIKEEGTSITGLSDNVVTLLDVTRTDTGFQFNWQNFNPTKFPLKTHIGTPPVIGSDGVIYGVYESLDFVSIPLTPPNENMQWPTEVTVSPDASNFYILLAVESKGPKKYVFYVLDISDQ